MRGHERKREREKERGKKREHEKGERERDRETAAKAESRMPNAVRRRGSVDPITNSIQPRA